MRRPPGGYSDWRDGTNHGFGFKPELGAPRALGGEPPEKEIDVDDEDEAPSDESEYVSLTNLVKLRIASQILGSVIETDDTPEVLLSVAKRVTARLVVHLESQRNLEAGIRAEWPFGPCMQATMIPCSLPKEHDGGCS